MKELGSNAYANEQRLPRKAAAIFIAFSTLTVGACGGSKHPHHKRPLAPSVTTATLPALTPTQQIGKYVKEDKHVEFYTGDLITANGEGASKLVLRPIILPRYRNYGLQINSRNYDFFALVANKVRGGHTEVEPEEISLAGLSVHFKSDHSSNSIVSSVVSASGKTLINSPNLFNPADNNFMIDGYDVASFNYHTLGNTYFVATEGRRLTPVGVLMEGQAIKS